uniref:Uncharacterized protein n=2 Tax=Anguilla anguilla TaxID=7936 RepID=A0A0E9XZL5_ANGAN
MFFVAAGIYRIIISYLLNRQICSKMFSVTECILLNLCVLSS